MLLRLPILIGWPALLLLLLPQPQTSISPLYATKVIAPDSIAPPYQAYAFICSDEIYIWNSMLLSTEGTYRDTFLSENNQDSTVELHLKIISAGRSDQYITLCPEVPLIWGGKAYTTPGIFCDTIRTLAGCDSIACMHISVLDPAPVTMIGTALCPGTAYEWNGRAYQTPGIYIKTFPSKSGCDSIVQLRIEVLDSIPVTYIDSIVAPERVSAEMLTDTLPGYFGCDSVVVIRFRRP